MKNKISGEYQPKMIVGVVVAGANNGEKMGVKTANLDEGLAKGLAKGLYVCSVEIAGVNYSGLLYYGLNSLTQKNSLEVHILKFSRDIYGEMIKITVGRFLRRPKKFKKPEDLKTQMEKDLQQVI